VQPFQVITLGKPEAWLLEAAASIGLDFSPFAHEITDHFRNHVINRHGDPAKHGTATVINTDFDRIPAIVKTPDMAVVGAIRRGNLCNVYIKIETGMTYLYFDEVLNSKRNKALRSSTFYKITRPLSLDEVLKNTTRNDRTDVSKAKILTLTI
jgi:hypothetical protein